MNKRLNSAGFNGLQSIVLQSTSHMTARLPVESNANEMNIIGDAG